jgi:hypothetical protein
MPIFWLSGRHQLVERRGHTSYVPTQRSEVGHERHFTCLGQPTFRETKQKTAKGEETAVRTPA